MARLFAILIFISSPALGAVKAEIERVPDEIDDNDLGTMLFIFRDHRGNSRCVAQVLRYATRSGSIVRHVEIFDEIPLPLRMCPQ